MHVLLHNDYLIRVYQSLVAISQKYFLLCLKLSVTYYVQSHAGIIAWSLACSKVFVNNIVYTK